ncbi:hypothetical protein WG66_003862 [Moniliophthora roreri]|uniref:Uncharacterized protein n=1 Tax=Moniliophthora roreri TaxID=221103 RepID=A0A0W0FN17_MONRR|nr:hypothetical protein WG66_003862 [Moniliophthora roreri]
MLWILWTVLVLHAGAFTIDPINVSVTQSQPITITWHREPQETEPFVIVKSGVGQGRVNGPLPTVTVPADPTQLSGTVEVTFAQTTEFVLYAYQTDSGGREISTIYTDSQTVTVAPPVATPETSNDNLPPVSPASGNTNTSSSGSIVDNTGLSTTPTNGALSDAYSTSASEAASNVTIPTGPVSTTEALKNSNNSGKRNIIIGSTIGGVVFLILLLVLFLLCRRRRRNRKPNRISTFTSGSGLLFDRERMVKSSPPKVDSGAIYSPISRSSTPAPSFTETAITGVTYETEIPRPRARTDRQMEIEEKIQLLQSEIISVSRSYGRSSPEEAEIREKIDRLHVLKEGDWALERSDEKPTEMW